jgi:maltose alpha-D-glucosyltransferase/alpha-amylase
MHLALAMPSEDPAFSPEPLTASDLESVLSDFRQEALGILAVFKDNMARLPDQVVDAAAFVLSRRRHILDQFHWAGSYTASLGQRTRIHGDYRLNKVLRVKTNYVILDFEGVITRPLSERRAKQCPLKDVAGMIRSLSYATYATLMNYTSRHTEDLARLEPWARLWERSTTREFLSSYRDRTQGTAFLPASQQDFRQLLKAYLLEQVLRELLAELNHRPAWVHIPLIGLTSLLT